MVKAHAIASRLGRIRPLPARVRALVVYCVRGDQLGVGLAMQRQSADRRLDRAVLGAMLRMAFAAGTLVAGALLAGCSSTSDTTLTIFADPGKYQYYTCDQISAQRKFWTTREQELRLLMDKADQGAGGAVVNVLAYKADHVAASEELKVLESTGRAKNCETPANWKSNSSIK